MFVHRLRDNSELRLLELRHAEEMFALIEQNRAFLRRWLPESDVKKSEEECKTLIRMGLEQLVNGGGLSVGIWLEKRLAGMIGLGGTDWENRSSSIGYWLGESYQGKGLVTDGCRAVIDYAFSELKLHRLEIRCATDNPKSCAIPQRLGFRKEGVLRQAQVYDDRHLDIEVYGLLAAEWKPEAGPPATKPAGERALQTKQSARTRVYPHRTRQKLWTPIPK